MSGASHPWSRIPWKTTSSRPAYDNRWIKGREDLAELPSGQTTVYGVVECARNASACSPSSTATAWSS